jgi:S-(hydroxymethyl)glutathione dehydrogenase/alcohol dehydrogenase
VGIAAGRATAPVEITRLVRRGLRVIGSYGARTRTDMPEILRLAATGAFRLETFVTRRYSLAESEAAYQALNRGEIAGRAVVVP